MLQRVWEDVRGGAEHFQQRSVPLPVNRLRQFVHGLCLPFHLARTLLADGATRWRYLTVSLAQAVTIVVLAVLFTGSGKEVVETIGPEEWSQEREAELEARLEAAEQELEAAEQELKEAVHTAEQFEKVAEGAAVIAGTVGVDREALRAKVKEALEAEKQKRDALRAAGPRKLKVRRVVYWAVFFSFLHTAQWIVIALSRDYHTALSREASLLSGVPPEDEPLAPRVRLNIQWLRNKLRRRWRALVVFATGVPLLWVLKKLLIWGSDAGELLTGFYDGLFTALLTAWGAWWFVVFTAGKSALAWREQSPREPWFLRGWNWLGSRAAPLRPAVGSYGALWKRFTLDTFSPAASVERQPWSLSGLAVTRAFAALPLVKCFLRPFIPVAAAHLLLAGEAGAGEGSARPGQAEPVGSDRAAS
jgi:hypothetical protein